MCRVEWFHQVLPLLNESSIKVLSVLLQFPRRGLTSANTPALTPRVSLWELQVASKLPRRSIQRGLGLLIEIGLVKVHRSTSPRGATTYVIPLEIDVRNLKRPKRGGANPIEPGDHPGDKLSPQEPVRGDRSYMRGDKMTPPLTTHGGADDNLLPETGKEIDITPTPHPGGDSTGDNLSPLVKKLVAIGFTRAESFVAANPADRIEAALVLLEGDDSLDNPAGYLRRLVEGNETIPAPKKQDKDPDRYIKGKYGHLVRR